jgi:seryl-tRNA synthetase
MLDLRLIREQPEVVRHALARRGEESGLDALLALDEQRRSLIHEAEELRAQRNQASRLMADPAHRHPAAVEEMRRLGDRVGELEARLKEIERRLEERLLYLPNLPDPSVPQGPDATGNRVVRAVG